VFPVTGSRTSRRRYPPDPRTTFTQGATDQCKSIPSLQLRIGQVHPDIRPRNRDKRNARTNIYESIQPSPSTQCSYASEEQITFMTQTPPYSTIEVESPKQDEKAACRGRTFVDFFLSRSWKIFEPSLCMPHCTNWMVSICESGKRLIAWK